jgi:hypothetical protein
MYIAVYFIQGIYFYNPHSPREWSRHDTGNSVSGGNTKEGEVSPRSLAVIPTPKPSPSGAFDLL